MTEKEILVGLISACEAGAIRCMVCSFAGVRVDAVCETLLDGGYARPSCREHARYPATINGRSMIVGIAPLAQPRHVIAARFAAAQAAQLPARTG